MYAFSFWYWGLRTQYLLDPEPNENRTNIRIRIRSSSFKNRIPIFYLRKNIPELWHSVKSSGMEKIFFRYWHSLRDEGKKKQKDPDSPILVLTFFEIKRDFLLSLCLYIIKRMRISLLSLCYYYERKQKFFLYGHVEIALKDADFPTLLWRYLMRKSWIWYIAMTK